MFLSVRALAIYQINNTLEEYRKYFQEAYLCELCLESCNFTEGISRVQIKNLISQKIFLRFNLAIVPTSIKFI